MEIISKICCSTNAYNYTTQNSSSTNIEQVTLPLLAKLKNIKEKYLIKTHLQTKQNDSNFENKPQPPHDEDFIDRNLVLQFLENKNLQLAKLFDSFKSSFLESNSNHTEVFQERRRRQRNMMMSIMMFGIVAVTMILVPMGFQFLAVLGGKAILIAKMALILTSIQGLKKIATSSVNYGLYSAPPQDFWRNERQWPFIDSHGTKLPNFPKASDPVDENFEIHPYPYQSLFSNI